MAKAFKLKFNPSEINALAAQYEYVDDAEALASGRRIAAGDYSLRNLKKIVAWKSSRSTGRFDRNSQEDVEDALRLAVEARTERAAVAVLLGLHGVQVPVASAILTAFDPSKFTIIDYRALESLGVKQLSPTVDFYLDYLGFCRGLAKRSKCSLRELDRALWQWSASNPA